MDTALRSQPAPSPTARALPAWTRGVAWAALAVALGVVLLGVYLVAQYFRPPPPEQDTSLWGLYLIMGGVVIVAGLVLAVPWALHLRSGGVASWVLGCVLVAGLAHIGSAVLLIERWPWAPFAIALVLLAPAALPAARRREAKG